jgi:SAM-dependent methyltransferase
MRTLGPESAKNFQRRLDEGFFDAYLSGRAILDIGYKGEREDAEPITPHAIGVDLDFPGYDGNRLPFADASQDAVFASHVLEHITDYTATLLAWYRVLRIGGYLIIAVPHRDLYERKANPPSRFNGDHKRFYTSGSLLAEIESSLPVAGFRVRSLREIDDGFDYGVAPERHAVGSYEIELVIEKIATPDYTNKLRPNPIASDIIQFYTAFLARRINPLSREPESKENYIFLRGLPIPPFSLLLNKMIDRFPEIDKNTLSSHLQGALKPILVNTLFDRLWYISKYPDIEKTVKQEPSFSPHSHYVNHGYYEGRLGCEISTIFE